MLHRIKYTFESIFNIRFEKKLKSIKLMLVERIEKGILLKVHKDVSLKRKLQYTNYL